MFEDLKARLNKRWIGWLQRRIPATDQITLGHKSIFIFLNRQGLLFVTLLLLLLVTAINYKNNLIYALTFWLFSFSLVVMLVTYRNLAGLKMTAVSSSHCFVGDEVSLQLELSCEKKAGHFALSFAWPGFIASQVDSIQQGQNHKVVINYKAKKRGHLHPERLRLSSSYPMGIYKSWSWLAFKFDGIVYPKPIISPIIFALDEQGEEEVDAHQNFRQGDEFAGVRNYQPGDPLKNIAWKQSAKGKGLQTKQLEQQEYKAHLLSFELLPSQNIEQQICLMTGWVIQAQEQNLLYAMKFHGIFIEADNSDRHYHECLTALALYQVGDSA